MSAKKGLNRLNREKSPYLLQHAHNPVDWYPWGEEAFEKARQENKPVLVSIGYSTCHWCHVMAHESFEDEEVAKMLNERFVSIKVDREERPDIDSIYMKVCQALTGQGGWPLNVFLTPRQKPFYAGTYFPKESRFGYPGFKDVIVQIYDQFKKDPDKIESISVQITDAIKKHIPEKGSLDDSIFEKTMKQLISTFDETYGGFSNEPKFPSPHMLTYLLRCYRHSGNEKALEMVTKTLDSMADGGIYDHIGYGFSRYSVDRQWLVPHFEKMLYDNAMLAIAYTEAYQVTKKTRYQQITEEICSYVIRDMTSEHGGFYSAEDADSEGKEGKFYVWSLEEVMNILGSELGELFCMAYDISEEGNFEGKNIPNLIGMNLHELAKRKNLSIETLENQLEQARKTLFQVRAKRIHPSKDDKILSSWNALMVVALAKAGRVFQNSGWLHAANNAIHFIENNLFADERLMARYREGEVDFKGYLDDYAFLLWAYIELYEATLEIYFLKKAKMLADDMIELFWDKQDGGFYFYGEDAEKLIVRPKEGYDGALPSGNSVAALQLLRLAKLTGNTDYEERVAVMQQVFAKEIKQFPSGYLYFMQSVLFSRTPTKEIVLLGVNPHSKNDQNALQKLQQSFLPEVTFLISKDLDQLADIASYTKDFHVMDEQATIYVCEHFACKQPTTNINQAVNQIIERNST